MGDRRGQLACLTPSKRGREYKERTGLARASTLRYSTVLEGFSSFVYAPLRVHLQQLRIRQDTTAGVLAAVSPQLQARLRQPQISPDSRLSFLSPAPPNARSTMAPKKAKGGKKKAPDDDEHWCAISPSSRTLSKAAY